MTALTPTTTIANTAQTGGIAGLWLSGLGLNGTLPDALQELLTVRLVSLSKNSLSGSIPSSWCVSALCQLITRGRPCH